MTVAVAWVRTIRDCEELVFVTDSRLSGDGCNFDACPKLLTLPRNDCLIAFAGYTGHAYPVIHQLALADRFTRTGAARVVGFVGFKIAHVKNI